MQLPETVQEIADVIGRDKALYLIGQLPGCRPASRKSLAVFLYVPTLPRLSLSHHLVQAIGLRDAEKLCKYFGGEILNVGTCANVYRGFRDKHIARLVNEGVPKKMVAEWFGVTERHVRNICKEIPQEVSRTAANDNCLQINTQRRRAGLHNARTF